jgi:predicted RND superfamily exporter protein
MLRRMEEFQRTLERDPSIGYSFSLVDIIRAVDMVFHELEPKWGVIPNTWVDVGSLFFIYFSGSPPTETAKYVDPSYTTAHVTFYMKDHKGENIRRVIHRAKQFIFQSQAKDLGLTLKEENGTVVIADVAKDIQWEKAGPSWVVSEHDTGQTPFQVGDVIKGLGKLDVTDLDSFKDAINKQTAAKTLVDFRLQRNGQIVEETVVVPWKAAFKLAGGLIGTLAAANEELVRNDALMNFLGFFTMWMIMLFTYRSFAAGLYLLAPLALANVMVNAYMAIQNIGVNIHTLPLVTVGLGFGIDYGLYIVSRTIEEIRVRGDLRDSVREALETSGKAVTFTAVTMVISTIFWTTSNIRFNAEMGLLLAIWMAISYVGSQTLTPVLIVLFKPRFIMREANRAPRLTHVHATAAAR